MKKLLLPKAHDKDENNFILGNEFWAQGKPAFSGDKNCEPPYMRQVRFSSPGPEPEPYDDFIDDFKPKIEGGGKLARDDPVALHTLALREYFARLADLGIRRSHLDSVNLEGLTPLALSVKLGKRELFESVWRDNSKQIWSYGASSGVCARLYPLDGIDNIAETLLPISSEQPAAAAAPAERSCCSSFCMWVLRCFLWWLPLPFFLAWERPRRRQLTCEDVLVRHDKWALLEPQDTDSSTLKQYFSGSATFAALALSEHKKRDADLDESRAEKIFSSFLTESNRWLHTEHRQTTVSLDGDSYIKKDASSMLEQLSERKWSRFFAPRFYRLAFFRFLFVLLVWAYLSLRMCSPLGGNVSMMSAPPSSGLLSCTSIGRDAVMAFSVLSGLLFAVHLVRFLLLGLFPLAFNSLGACWARGGCSPVHKPQPDKRKIPFKPYEETRGAAIFQSAHSGRFGGFHLVSLLLGSGLLFVGSLVDLHSGLSKSHLVYSIGCFFISVHLIYFLIGWEYTGPLVVMLFNVVHVEFWRWLCLFVSAVPPPFFFALRPMLSPTNPPPSLHPPPFHGL